MADPTPSEIAGQVRAARAGAEDKAEDRGYDPDGKLQHDTEEQREAYDDAYEKTEADDD